MKLEELRASLRRPSPPYPTRYPHGTTERSSANGEFLRFERMIGTSSQFFVEALQRQAWPVGSYVFARSVAGNPELEVRDHWTEVAFGVSGHYPLNTLTEDGDCLMFVPRFGSTGHSYMEWSVPIQETPTVHINPGFATELQSRLCGAGWPLVDCSAELVGPIRDSKPLYIVINVPFGGWTCLRASRGRPGWHPRFYIPRFHDISKEVMKSMTPAECFLRYGWISPGSNLLGRDATFIRVFPR